MPSRSPPPPPTTAAADDADALLPLIIGVTGHRDPHPADVPRLEAETRAFIMTLRRRLPSTPLVLLTPLAEGADRLAARIFREACGGDARHRIIVPLPLPAAEYRRDFADDASRAEFDALLRAGTAIPLPVPAGEPREAAYERVGALVARHSHVLLAYWDGRSTDRRGGTADVVRFRLEGRPTGNRPEARPLDPPDTGPLYHLHTRRASVDSGGDAPPPSMRYPADADTAGARALPGALEAFNRAGAALLRAHPDRVARARAALLPPDGDAPSLSAAEHHALRVFGVADALALANQAAARRVIRLLLATGVMAVAANQVFADHVKTAWMAGVYLGLLVLGGGVLLVANRFDWQRKHFNHRALAEALRVQFFWRTADVPASVPDSYLRNQWQALQPVRQALRLADLLAHGHPPARGDEAVARLRLARRAWVRHQRAYFLGTAEREGRAARLERNAARIRWFVRVAFVLAVLSVAVLLVLDDPARMLVSHGDAVEVELRDAVLGFGTLALALAAAAATYGELMGYAEHARSSRRMGALFARAEARLAELLDDSAGAGVEEARRVLADAGREALAENGDWVILHHDRPWEFTPG